MREGNINLILPLCRLKHFSFRNFNVSGRAAAARVSIKGESASFEGLERDSAYFTANSCHEAIGAYISYGTMASTLFPGDPTPWIFMRVLQVKNNIEQVARQDT